ncbi:MAG: hypothetical protein ABI569_02450, partial [Casimicrobiaceae bacterium]
PTTFPGAVKSNNIQVDVDTILDHLKFTFMGTFEARKGPLGLYTDLIYLNVGGDKSQTRDVTIGGVPLPGGVTGDFNFDLKTTIWTIAGEYRVATDPTSHVDILAGARLADARQSLGWNFSADLGPINNPGRSGNKEVSVNNWDGIIGAKGRIGIPGASGWFAPWYADVGTGQSDLTWQVIGGIGYSFKWGEVIGAWRYMDYKFKSGAPIEKLTLNGPAMGVAFRW